MSCLTPYVTNDLLLSESNSTRILLLLSSLTSACAVCIATTIPNVYGICCWTLNFPKSFLPSHKAGFWLPEHILHVLFVLQKLLYSLSLSIWNIYKTFIKFYYAKYFTLSLLLASCLSRLSFSKKCISRLWYCHWVYFFLTSLLPLLADLLISSLIFSSFVNAVNNSFTIHSRNFDLLMIVKCNSFGSFSKIKGTTTVEYSSYQPSGHDNEFTKCPEISLTLQCYRHLW